MIIDDENMAFFLRLDSMSIKDKKIIFRTSKLNVYALKSIGLNLGKMTNSRISKASVVRYSIFRLYENSNYEEIIEKRKNLVSTNNEGLVTFSMYLDNITEKNIINLIKKGKSLNIRLSRNDILEIACKDVIDNWVEIKNNLEK